jgi:D-alanyl-D-alanine dipeptidase
MKKREIYQLLEDKMLGYADYVGVPTQPRNEPPVPIARSRYLAARQVDQAMAAFTGSRVYVRQGVYQRLLKAGKLLTAYDKRLRLEVVYGYRALEIQQQLFEKYETKLLPSYRNRVELLAAVHRFIAVPEAAGHPTGAAVDIQILCGAEAIDFGTSIHTFAPDSFTFSPFITREAWSNRQLLRRIMLQVGFAPFDGEWWHFSYGDKEWARYYNQPYALYEQIVFSTIKDLQYNGGNHGTINSTL